MKAYEVFAYCNIITNNHIKNARPLSVMTAKCDKALAVANKLEV